ncbi:hypothetical protein HMPREF9446_01664 [Bacteroides fluxus YIT 12057]|uniref:Uncharacterized protein n=1 Tax=Bacteroides fluxus YIT 12057 TaxID=763034 RepID=F3PSD0_9BACE|nr:hypothetical protein HMPREF9446_01664 [Bacteroides fluxus YIT 12057]
MFYNQWISISSTHIRKDDAVADSDVWQHPEKKKNKLANKSRSDVLL